MRIATWNIGGGFISDNKHEFTKKNLNYFIQELKKINADCMVLQEVHNNNNSLNEFEELSKKSFVSSKLHESHIEKDMSVHLLGLTNYEVLSVETIFLPNPHLSKQKNDVKLISHNKALLKIQIKYEEKTVNIINIQLLPLQIFDCNYRDDKFAELRNEIEKMLLFDSIPTIICGDFNYENLEKIFPRLYAAGFQNAFSNIQTGVYENTQKDHILVSKEWNVKDFEVIKGKADHFLCFADVELKNK